MARGCGAAPRELTPVAGPSRRLAFRVTVGLTTLFLLVMLLPTYALLFTNWLPTEAWLAVRPDRARGDQIHRLHSLALSVISWGILPGVALQLHRPERKLGALLMSLATVVGVAGGLALIGTLSLPGIVPFLLPILVVCALHPRAGTILRVPRVDRPMLALAAIAAAFWIANAVEVSAAARLAGLEGDAEHLGFMVIVALLIPLWAALGSTDHPGWVFPAGAAVLASACVALQSLVFPDALSALAPPWAWAALVWCGMYGAAAWMRGGGSD